MPLKTTRFEAAEVLDTAEAIEAFLERAFDSADPAFVTHALGVVARAQGMSQPAKPRQALKSGSSALRQPRPKPR